MLYLCGQEFVILDAERWCANENQLKSKTICDIYAVAYCETEQIMNKVKIL